ncbi:hypothetical protein Dsin_029975 [Dipteronia sinensis]|uniref:RNase H type-1 domain-containing protein n=1 Tax=Dipteronia sinensis TaxID=43782 RepID=A0AAE0DQQ9_9ROSI|nr:hypothetical protein Dsin_029975 [Dipteronia sinensis]
MCPFMKNVRVSDEGYFIDFMITCRIQLQCQDMELLCMVLLRVWFRRNNLVFKSVNLYDTDIVPWAVACLDDFRSAYVKLVGGEGRSQKASILWQPLCIGFYKVNLDAADEIVGIGIIACNSQGQVMGCNAQKILSRYSPQVAEALAVLRGIQFTRDMGLWPCVFESDALSVVKLVNDNIVPCSDVGLILRDILLLSGSFPCFSLGFVPRNGNMAAHRLDKFGLVVQADCFWCLVRGGWIRKEGAWLFLISHEFKEREGWGFSRFWHSGPPSYSAERGLNERMEKLKQV